MTYLSENVSRSNGRGLSRGRSRSQSRGNSRRMPRSQSTVHVRKRSPWDDYFFYDWRVDYNAKKSRGRSIDRNPDSSWIQAHTGIKENLHAGCKKPKHKDDQIAYHRLLSPARLSANGGYTANRHCSNMMGEGKNSRPHLGGEYKHSHRYDGCGMIETPHSRSKYSTRSSRSVSGDRKSRTTSPSVKRMPTAESNEECSGNESFGNTIRYSRRRSLSRDRRVERREIIRGKGEHERAHRGRSRGRCSGHRIEKDNSPYRTNKPLDPPEECDGITKIITHAAKSENSESTRSSAYSGSISGKSSVDYHNHEYFNYKVNNFRGTFHESLTDSSIPSQYADKCYTHEENNNSMPLGDLQNIICLLESGDTRVKEKQQQLKTKGSKFSRMEKKNAIIDMLEDQIDSLMYASDFIKEEYMMNKSIQIATGGNCLEADTERFEERMSVEAEGKDCFNEFSTKASHSPSFDSISVSQFDRKGDCSDAKSVETFTNYNDLSSKSCVTEYSSEQSSSYWGSSVGSDRLNHDDASTFDCSPESSSQYHCTYKISGNTSTKLNMEKHRKKRFSSHRKLLVWIKKIKSQDKDRARKSQLGVNKVCDMEWTDFEGRHGIYSGRINHDNIPHGKGLMIVNDSDVIKEGLWVNGVLNKGKNDELYELMAEILFGSFD